ncbi:MAG: isoprenylcysteine carboxylmethyltransferase family protein [Gemmatimonadetes bacterium]|nr:isoprenylcysteine carboxylmethyltransferase family protein [Gemmatimonadota bacterium]
MLALRHLLSILILPVTMVILVPAWILRGQDPRPAFPATTAAWGMMLLGVATLAVGAAFAGASVGLFARHGRGTLAPWDPPRRLVVRGVYAHVRNPMISGVTFVLLGEAAILRSVPHLEWAVGFALVNAAYILLVEERGLQSRFGSAYEVYARNVPRLVPRLRAWNPEAERGRGRGR